MSAAGFDPLGGFDTVMSDVRAYDYFTARRYARYVFDELELGTYGEGSLIDVGCQFGALGEMLAGGPLKYVGVDIDTDALREARRRLPEAEFLAYDIEDNRVLSEGAYDVVVCSLVLGLLKDARVACENLMGLARKEGQVMVIDLLRDSESGQFGEYAMKAYVEEQISMSVAWGEVERLAERMRKASGGRQVRLVRLCDDGASLSVVGSGGCGPARRGLSVFELRVG